MIYFPRNSADNPISQHSLIIWNMESKIHEIIVIIWEFCKAKSPCQADATFQV